MSFEFNRFEGNRVVKESMTVREIGIPEGLLDGNAYYAWLGKRWICFRDNDILAIGYKDCDHFWLAALCQHLNGYKDHITAYKLDFGFKQPKIVNIESGLFDGAKAYMPDRGYLEPLKTVLDTLKH